MQFISARVTRFVQRRERSSSTGTPETCFDCPCCSARLGHEQARRWVPFKALDFPSMAGDDTLLTARPDAHGRVAAGCGKTCVLRRETETAYGFAVCFPRGEVVHVGLEILHDTGLRCGHDVGAGVIEGEYW